MMKTRCAFARIALAITSIALQLATASAQTTAPGRVPTVSRLVKQFTEQETRLAAQIRAGDTAGAGSLLADDFELRAASQPGRPVPRAEWLRQSMRSPGPDATPTQMAVHDLDGSAVVSFLQSGSSANASVFVVDVWRRAGVEWKLAVRYIAPAGANASALPGVPPGEPEIPKRY
jgi:hypothetical protein